MTDKKNRIGDLAKVITFERRSFDKRFHDSDIVVVLNSYVCKFELDSITYYDVLNTVNTVNNLQFQLPEHFLSFV